MESPFEENNGPSINGEVPTALFIGASKNPEEIIKSLMKLNSKDNLIGFPIEENVECFKWKLDNKYYTADINLSILKSKSITSPEFSETVEAVILYADTTMESSLTDLESWLPFIKDYNTSIEMLVCKNCCDSTSAKPNKNDVMKWCLDNDFELVELEPLDAEQNNEDDDGYEDDIPDVYGIARVEQALNAHIWPNLVRKERSEPTSFDALKSGGALHEQILASSSSSSHPLEVEEKISQLLAGVTPEPDLEFGELFQELASMKERMSGMSTERRKKTAEQIVMAFWKGIGGDEDELELSDEEEGEK